MDAKRDARKETKKDSKKESKKDAQKEASLFPQAEGEEALADIGAKRQAQAQRMLEYQPLGWEALPDLGLYMDQVITFLERQLAPLHPSGLRERIITPAMINNYVKMQIIARPVGKKYERGHLAALLMLCTLKQVLPMDDIGRLLASHVQHVQDIRQGYEAFCDQQRAAFRQASAALSAPNASALACAVQASALCLAAETLLPSAPRAEKG